MVVKEYLERINYAGPIQPVAQVLKLLHIAHMHTVPFENLDVYLGRPIHLDQNSLYDKIVRRKRGGFCYELNGLLGALLTQIGFQVDYLSARDVQKQGQLSAEYDHLALRVGCPNDPGNFWLADVGWGDSFTSPLSFEAGGEQIEGLRAYRLERQDEFYYLWQRNYDGTHERQYRFSLQPRRFPQDFEGMCQYHQTSPKSIFTQKRICTLATPAGRISLEGKRLITTQNGIRNERPLIDEEEFQQLLGEKFGVQLDRI